MLLLLLKFGGKVTKLWIIYQWICCFWSAKPKIKKCYEANALTVYVGQLHLLLQLINFGWLNSADYKQYSKTNNDFYLLVYLIIFIICNYKILKYNLHFHLKFNIFIIFMFLFNFYYFTNWLISKYVYPHFLSFKTRSNMSWLYYEMLVIRKNSWIR